MRLDSEIWGYDNRVKSKSRVPPNCGFSITILLECLKSRKRLLSGSVPDYNFLLSGRVPDNNFLLSGTPLKCAGCWVLVLCWVLAFCAGCWRAVQ